MTRKPTSKEPKRPKDGARGAVVRRGDRPVPSVRSLRFDVVNPGSVVERIYRQTMQVLSDDFGARMMHGFAPVGLVGGSTLVFAKDQHEHADHTIRTMQRLARACVFYATRATDADRHAWHEEIRRLVHDAFHAPAQQLGEQTRERNTRSGFTSASERRAVRAPTWQHWQALAQQHWANNPRLSPTRVADLIATEVQGTEHAGKAEAIRKRIKKSGTERART